MKDERALDTPQNFERQLTVAICTRGRGALIRSTLLSILSGEVLPAEIVVVDQSDDNSTEDTVTAIALTEPRVRLFRTATRGVSQARNVALREAHGDVIAFTDDDVVVAADWLRIVAAEFDAYPDLALLFGTVLPPETYDWHTEFIPYSHVPTTRPVRWHDSATHSVMGANMSLRRSLCRAIGEFDVALGPGASAPTGEDWEYALRALCLRPVPLRVHLVDGARVVHHAGARRGMEYRRFVHQANGTGQGMLWAHLLRRGTQGSRFRYLMKFAQEEGRVWTGFAKEIICGRRPTGVITYAYRLRGLARGLLARGKPESESV